MPVIQCPNCQKSLNVKQIPAGGRIKCPGCSKVFAVGGGGGSAARPAARPAPKRQAASRPAGGRALTPDDEGFDFGQIQYPAAGPLAVTHFPIDPDARSVYEGPIPGDPMGESSGGSPAAGNSAAGQRKGKPKGRLSPKALAAILGGVLVFLLVAIGIGTMLTGGDSGGDAQENVPPPGETP